MEIKNLVTFLRVAELSSFTKAAQVLDYSQSTISFQIKQLETELNCLLFERINHTLLLTAEGREMLDYAKQFCQLTDEFHQRRAVDEQVSGQVHLVIPDSVCKMMILENYSDFYRRYPGIHYGKNRAKAFSSPDSSFGINAQRTKNAIYSKYHFSPSDATQIHFWKYHGDPVSRHKQKCYNIV